VADTGRERAAEEEAVEEEREPVRRKR